MRNSQTLLPVTILALGAAATAQWTQITPTNSPTPRIEAQMAIDTGANATVLFGGADNGGFPPTTFSDTWTFDGLDWTQQSPTNVPPARYFGGMAYDVGRGVTVLYGGLVATLFGANYRDDTWEWNGTDWTQVTTAATPGSLIGNPGVGEVTIAYDFVGQRIVLFGGELFQGIVPAPNVTLEYDGVNWTQASPAVSPPRRSQASLCTAPTLGGVLLFGGTNFNNPPGPNGEIVWNDTWVYDSLADTWTQLQPTGTLPTARAGASLLFDPNLGLYVLHGGYTDNNGTIQPLSDTWTFDGTTWTDVSSTYGSPSGPRVRFASAEAPHGCQVLFGGSSAVFGTINNETWMQGCTGTTARSWNTRSWLDISSSRLNGTLTRPSAMRPRPTLLSIDTRRNPSTIDTPELPSWSASNGV
ncbi:MAG: hypothetical protein KDE27_08465, partial [Planctomycetes bacterium]|nr:hypothetical protein [Planctomycetota bacterium]